jgi:hypothetical protein
LNYLIREKSRSVGNVGKSCMKRGGAFCPNSSYLFVFYVSVSQMTTSFKVSSTCMDTLLCLIYWRCFLALFPSSFVVSRESSIKRRYLFMVTTNSNRYAEWELYGVKRFSLFFNLKVNSTFQNWTIIFVHFGISENSFKFPNKLLNYLIREKSRSVGPSRSFLSNHKSHNSKRKHVILLQIHYIFAWGMDNK